MSQVPCTFLALELEWEFLQVPLSGKWYLEPKSQEQGILTAWRPFQRAEQGIINRNTALLAQLVMNPPAMRETWVQSLRWEDSLEKGKATHSGLENSMDNIVHEVAKNPTQLSHFHFSLKSICTFNRVFILTLLTSIQQYTGLPYLLHFIFICITILSQWCTG